MKKVCLSLLMGLMVQMTFGQTLEKMQWFNEPEQWEIKNNVLSMSVTPQSDYWRISHYGFTVDDAPPTTLKRKSRLSESIKNVSIRPA